MNLVFKSPSLGLLLFNLSSLLSVLMLDPLQFIPELVDHMTLLVPELAQFLLKLVALL
jgi:hypothetical protein